MRRLLLSLFIIIILLVCINFTLADAPWYVVPVKVIFTDSTYELGFIPLYGDEIRGFVSDNKEIKLIAAFGMNSPSTNEQKWECVNYDFDLISITNQDVSIIYVDRRYDIKKVEFFFTEKGLVFCNRIGLSKKGLVWDRKNILMKELKMIQRIGEVTHVPGGSY